MLALSMVVIASMIAVGGLGQMVLRGIGRLDMGLASVGGAGIVILAIILDRLTQSLGKDSAAKPAAAGITPVQRAYHPSVPPRAVTHGRGFRSRSLSPCRCYRGGRHNKRENDA